MSTAPKRVLVVHCHPVPESFGAAVHDRTVSALRAAGHTVDVIDLYAENFSPCLTAEEWRNERVGYDARPYLADHAERLLAADWLVLTYPTWFGGPPAMLKGWFDRIFMEGVAYVLPEGANRIKPRLRSIKRIVIVTTHGGSRLVNLVQGEPGRLMVFRGLRLMFHPLCRTNWIALYSVDAADEAARHGFLHTIDERIRKL